MNVYFYSKTTKFQLKLVLLLSLLFSSTNIWADTVTANFNSGLPEGWTIVGDINNDGDRARSGKGIWTYSKSSTDNYVITENVQGTFEFWARAYNKNTASYVDIYEYTGSGLGQQLYTTGNMRTSTTPTWSKYSFTLTTNTQLAIVLNYAAIDDVTYTQYVQAEGASMALKVGVEELQSGSSHDFGLVEPGATATMIVQNNGTVDFNMNAAVTNGYAVSPTNSSIKAGEQQVLTITMPNATATGTLTVTGDDEGLSPITINLNCTMKDPAKMFVDFSSEMPEDWETEAVGSYYSDSYAWTVSNGYAATSAGSASYAGALTTTDMAFTNGEKLMFKAQKYADVSYNAPSLTVQYQENGTWKDAANAFTDMTASQWTDYEVSIPATANKIRFYGWYVKIDNVYGGKLLEVTPKPKLVVDGYANGSTLSWGYSEVPAGTEKTLTLKNTGKAELNVTIAATNDFTVSANQATIAAGGSFELKVGTPAHDGNGTLTITPDAATGLSTYTLTLTSYYKVPKAVMAVDKTTVAFGRCYANKSETITVSNTGDGPLTVTISCDNTARFSVSTAELSVAAGESGTFDISYLYDANISGSHTATVTLTPNDGYPKTITATASNKRQGVWSEDFEEGIPATWTNDGWTVGRKYSEASSVNHAYAGMGSGYLITPRLKATEGEELSFDFISQYATLKVEYANSIDAAEWSLLNNFEEDSTITFTAPATGTYYLRFSGSGSYLDNFEGFLLDLQAADAVITASALPATGNQFAVYTASVTVENKGSQAQTAVAKLYVNNELKDTKEEALGIESKATLTLSFTPQTAMENAAVKIEFTLKGVSTFAAKTVENALTIHAAPVLSETEASELTQGTLPVAVVKYTAQNGWNTICMPFKLTEELMGRLFGEGWKAFELKEYENDAIRMQEPTGFVAGYAYLVNAKNAPVNANGIVVENLQISATSANYDYRNGVTFQGTYAPIEAGQMTDKYTINADTMLVKGEATTTLLGYRGYYLLAETVTTLPELTFFNADGSSTVGITAPKAEALIRQGIFNLKGQRVETMKKGQLYIINGKKVIMR